MGVQPARILGHILTNWWNHHYKQIIQQILSYILKIYTIYYIEEINRFLS